MNVRKMCADLHLKTVEYLSKIHVSEINKKYLNDEIVGECKIYLIF